MLKLKIKMNNGIVIKKMSASFTGESKSSYELLLHQEN
jgi:hypothetical protein